MIADEILKLLERCKELGVDEYSQDGTTFRVKFHNYTPKVETKTAGPITFKTAEEVMQELPALTKEMVESLIGEVPPDLEKMSERELLLQGTGAWEALQEEELEKQRIEHSLMNQSGAV